MKSFWGELQHLIYRPDFFSTRPYTVGSGLKFYSLLLLIFIGLKVVLTLPAVIQFFTGVLSEGWEQQQAIVTNIFPDELLISVKNGTIITNVSEPYAIPMPNEWSDPRNGLPKNLLVIDTTKPIDTTDFFDADTFIFLGADSVGFHNPDRGEYRIISFQEVGFDASFILDQQKFTQFVVTVSHYLRVALIIGGILLPFVLYGMVWCGYLIYLIFGAVVVWVGAKWQGHHITYGSAYLAGMYLLPVPLGYALLTSHNLGIWHIPLAFSIILLFMTVINFKETNPVFTTIPKPEGDAEKE